MSIDYNNYPTNWKTEIRPRILERADHKCEMCGVGNYAYGVRDAYGFWCDREELEELLLDFDLFPVYPKSIKIVLTIAHLDDPDPMNCADDNLAALCQRCHLNYDRERNLKAQQVNRLKRIEEKRQANGERRLFE